MDGATLDDTIDGGSGNGIFFGYDGAPRAPTRKALRWTSEGPGNANIAQGFKQIMGEIEVSVSFRYDGNHSPTLNVESSRTHYIAPGEPFDRNSSLEFFADGDAASSTTTIRFAAAPGSVYSNEVRNVSFRINDVGAVGLDGILSPLREELFRVFLQLRSDSSANGPATRTFLKRREARALLTA